MNDVSPYDFLLPADAAIHLTRIESLTHISLDSAWGHFADADTELIFSARLKVAIFIDIEHFFDVKGQVIKLPDLTQTLNRVRDMVEGDSDLDLRIKLSLEPNKLTCRGQKEIGWNEEVADLEYGGVPISIVVNPLFLADILSRTQEIIVGEKTCLFWGENFRHVMMLIKE